MERMFKTAKMGEISVGVDVGVDFCPQKRKEGWRPEVRGD